MMYWRHMESEIREYLVERGWDTLRPSDVAKSICIEAAELLEIFQWTSVDIEETKKNSDVMEKIRGELADVLIYAFEMAVLLNLDTEQVIKKNLEHVRKKYPAALMQKNAKKGAGSGEDSAYWRIKNHHRKGARS
jgi:dCTP diphosphatase